MTTMIISAPNTTSLFDGRAVYSPEELDNATTWPLNFLRDLWNAPTALETADDLLDLAESYESTQPGYAADLRAAAELQAA